MDKIVRMIAKDAPVKAMAISATELVERARAIHHTLPVATAAFPLPVFFDHLRDRRAFDAVVSPGRRLQIDWSA